jgi:hypothetical protein
MNRKQPRSENKKNFISKLKLIQCVLNSIYMKFEFFLSRFEFDSFSWKIFALATYYSYLFAFGNRKSMHIY